MKINRWKSVVTVKKLTREVVELFASCFRSTTASIWTDWSTKLNDCRPNIRTKSVNRKSLFSSLWTHWQCLWTHWQCLWVLAILGLIDSVPGSMDFFVVFLNPNTLFFLGADSLTCAIRVHKNAVGGLRHRRHQHVAPVETTASRPCWRHVIIGIAAAAEIQPNTQLWASVARPLSTGPMLIMSESEWSEMRSVISMGGRQRPPFWVRSWERRSPIRR